MTPLMVELMGTMSGLVPSFLMYSFEGNFTDFEIEPKMSSYR